MMPTLKSIATATMICFGVNCAEVRAQICNPEGTSLLELRNNTECLEKKIAAMGAAMGKAYTTVSNRIDKVDLNLQTLSRMIGYGAVKTDMSVSFVRPIIQNSSGLVDHPKPGSFIEAINVTRERPGVYTVTFSPPQKVVPIVVVTPIGGNLQARIDLGSSWISRSDEQGFQVLTSRDGKILNDLGFNFIILSPEM
jgi:hypothetical protein